MMVRGKIAAVSYLNTVPFIYGIGHADNLREELLLSPPSQCAAAFHEGRADIALIPVAAIPSLPQAEIITSYCLGAHGSVRTVMLMSSVPAKNIRRIFLDSHSLSSVQLVRILAREHWQITPQWCDMTDYTPVEHSAAGDAFLLIGDKVFGYEGRFPYNYDLADCWREFTGLPFVFAAWVARPDVDPTRVAALEEALAYGVAHIPEAIENLGHRGKPYAHDYLTRNMDFLFDEQKHRALSLFWDKGMKCSPRVNPG